ncbi:histidine phosphatase family protein [Paenibacillus lutrae]|uniref:Histidine phosphatase family protein n=1 Tax=Paenibacillus lutrae TaxID=2078573 RepID=A0A7X3FLG5_9BACL|nr:histidine phosphatase family protein [Paenibacillus lutrae]MVP01830.1 histidine phosphatase family protein [Paenibacillus lutrae]
MQIILYFVRHAESVYAAGAERTRGLTEQGKQDAGRVRDLLMGEQIEVIVSSPYERASATIRELSNELKIEVIVEEDLRERQFTGEGYEIKPEHFYMSKRKLYEEWDFSFPGGESSSQAQKRAVHVLNKLMDEFAGKRIVVGTHGDIMTLMVNYFDFRYDYDFWRSTTMPDIYKLEFADKKLQEVTRLWSDRII